jgi:hypothetical protein
LRQDNLFIWWAYFFKLLCIIGGMVNMVKRADSGVSKIDEFLSTSPSVARLLSRLSDSNLALGIAVGLEADRLSQKYGKDAFGAEDLKIILGVGLPNIRELMNRPDFPTISVGNRKVVSALGLSAWLVKRYLQ